MLDYDEPARIAALRGLAPRLRVAWALLCAERALPGYRRACAKTGRGNPFLAECLAERLWFDVAGDAMTSEELEAARTRAEALLDDEDENDAAAALVFAFDARATGDPLEAAWAGRRLYDLADALAQRDLCGERSPATWTAADEARILGHPRVQRELGRQERDLRELASLADDFRDALERMKVRSASEAAELLAND